jgi:hypothetical protein
VVYNFLDLEAFARDGDDHSTDGEEEDPDRASFPYFLFYLYLC